MIMQWKEKVFNPYRRVTSNHKDEIQETILPGDHTKLKSLESKKRKKEKKELRPYNYFKLIQQEARRP